MLEKYEEKEGKSRNSSFCVRKEKLSFFSFVWS